MIECGGFKNPASPGCNFFCSRIHNPTTHFMIKDKKQRRRGRLHEETSTGHKDELNDAARKALLGLQKDPSFAVSLERLQQAGPGLAVAVAFGVAMGLQIQMMAVENYTQVFPYQLLVEAEVVHSRINQAGFEGRVRNLTHQRTAIPD